MPSVNDVSALGTILGVWAHPDDETYCMSGIMLGAARTGSRVVCVTATKGEAGSQDEERWPPATIAAVREAELLEALQILGVTEHRWLGYLDGHCHEVPTAEAVAKIADLIREIEPDSVLCFGPDGNTGHSDHIATCRWTTKAFDEAAKPGARLYYYMNSTEWMTEWMPLLEKYNVFMTDDRPETVPRSALTLDIQLTSEMLDRKFEALTSQRSQTEAFIGAVGERDFKRVIAEEGYVLAAER
jgi:LmbE family N-acetylglucosaminyl deacetylase